MTGERSGTTPPDTGNRRITRYVSAPVATMSAPPRRDEVTATAPLSETQSQLLAYLQEQDEGVTYLKAKFVAQDLDLSAKEVGINMAVLREKVSGIEIEQWARSAGSTWKVTRQYHQS